MTPNAIPSASGIYRITCTITGKFYIGSAVNLRTRWNHHLWALRNNQHHTQHLQNAWNKHGEQAFIFEVLELVLLPSLTMREQYWLNKLKPFGNKGYNIARDASSTLGLKHSLESRNRRSEAQRGKRPWLGKTHSPEAKEKQRLARLGKKRSPETIAKMIASKTGHKPDPTIYDARRKSLIIIEPDGTEHLVHGIRRFCREHDLDHSALKRVAQGKQLSHKGWKARYPDVS